MSVLNACNAGIYSKLSAGTALTTLLGGTAIYNQQAPDKISLPYVVFSLQAGGPTNITPSDMRDQIYFVRGYAASALAAGSIDAACSTLLHKQAITITGYTNFWTAREMDLATVENPPNGKPVYMAGGLYRIRLDD